MLAAVLLAAAPGPRWEVNGSAITATPAVLTQGLSLGAAAEATRRLRRGFLSARLGWSAPETDALFAPARTEFDVVAAGTALARANEGGTQP